MGNEAEQLKLHRELVVAALRRGRVVAFLGAGVNLCDRPQGLAWQPRENKYLPSGFELARHLASTFHYPAQPCPFAGKGCPRPEPELDLLRVSQFGATLLESGPLYEELHTLFGRDFPPTSAHNFLASLPSPLAPQSRPEDRHLLIVTTNYDDLMERALGDGNYDLVFYVPDDEPRARFWHRPPGQAAVPIENPNEYPHIFFEQRPVVLKIHGTVGRAEQEREGFVITEDQYIEYLAEEPLEKLLPPALLGKMRDQHHLLFLGYSLRDWNFRVFFRRLKRNSKKYKGWAVLLHSDEAEKQFWVKNGVDIIEQPLDGYIHDLAEALQGD